MRLSNSLRHCLSQAAAGRQLDVHISYLIKEIELKPREFDNRECLRWIFCMCKIYIRHDSFFTETKFCMFCHRQYSSTSAILTGQCPRENWNCFQNTDSAVCHGKLLVCSDDFLCLSWIGLKGGVILEGRLCGAARAHVMSVYQCPCNPSFTYFFSASGQVSSLSIFC